MHRPCKTPRALLCATLLLGTVPAVAGEPTGLAVMPMRGPHLDAETVDVLGALLLGQLLRLKGHRVVEVSESNSTLAPAHETLVRDCEDIICASEIGVAFGANRVLMSTADIIDDELRLTLELVDADTRERIETADARVGAKERLYPYAVSLAIARLFALPTPAPPGLPPPELAPPPPTETSHEKGAAQHVDIETLLTPKDAARYRQYASTRLAPLAVREWAAMQNTESDALFLSEVFVPLTGLAVYLFATDGLNSDEAAGNAFLVSIPTTLLTGLLLLVDGMDLGEVTLRADTSAADR